MGSHLAGIEVEDIDRTAESGLEARCALRR
jgi:hypothetical protein